MVHLYSRGAPSGAFPRGDAKWLATILPGETCCVTFLGNYVAHCHNLAHEDHNMMFGWSIVKNV